MNYRLLIFMIVFSAGFSFSQQIALSDPSTYLPDFLKDVKIGMTLSAFEEVKNTDMLEYQDKFNHIYVAYYEETQNGYIGYKFSTNGEFYSDPPLYEISINFSDIQEADIFVKSKFGKPDEGDTFAPEEWGKRSDNGDYFLVRKYDSTVLLISFMKGSEWDPEF